MTKEINPWEIIRNIHNMMHDGNIEWIDIKKYVSTHISRHKKKLDILRKAEKINAKYPLDDYEKWVSPESLKEISDMRSELIGVIENDNPFWCRWIGTYIKFKATK